MKFKSLCYRDLRLRVLLSHSCEGRNLGSFGDHGFTPLGSRLRGNDKSETVCVDSLVPCFLVFEFSPYIFYELAERSSNSVSRRADTLLEVATRLIGIAIDRSRQGRQVYIFFFIAEFL
jgi:hypothetical protein